MLLSIQNSEDKGEMSIAYCVQQWCECSDRQDNSYSLNFIYEETEIQIGSITYSQIYKTAAKWKIIPLIPDQEFKHLCSQKYLDKITECNAISLFNGFYLVLPIHNLIPSHQL